MPLGINVPQRHLFAVSCALQLADILWEIGNESDALDDDFDEPILVMLKDLGEEKERMFRAIVAHAEIVGGQAAIIERWRFVNEMYIAQKVVYCYDFNDKKPRCVIDILDRGQPRNEETVVTLKINGIYVHSRMKELSPLKN